MNKKKKKNSRTILAHSGRSEDYARGAVNIPPYRSSTVLFKTLQEYKDWDHEYATYRYGRLGSPNSLALEEAYTELSGAYRSIATNSGMSAINIAISAVMESGSHALITEGAYEPTAELFSGHLSKFGVEYDFISPTIGEEIIDLIKPNTKIIYLEAPSSNTFEVLDVKRVIDAIRKKSKEIGHEIAILFDNTWAGPLYFRTFEYDIDVEIQAATKYVVGHSDAMLGIVACNEKTYLKIKNSARNQGICAEPDACYLGLRGLRTMAVRMEAQFESAMQIANWLDSNPMVEKVLFPPLPNSEHYENWKKYFTGGGSLMSVILDKKYEDEDLEKYFDGMEIFSMGYSWGGFESLATPVRIQKERKSSLDQLKNTIVRIHVGLEDPEDLISDLDSAFKRL